MCIIIAHPHTGEIVPESTLAQCAENNPHGMGIAYACNGTLSVFHNLTRFKKLVGKYKYAVSRGCDVLIHFRVATHGEVSEANCHPYWVNSNLVVAHNGQINVPGLPKVQTKGSISDTKAFIKRILQPLEKNVPDWHQSQATRDLIMNYIGHSKLVFLNRSGKLDIFGEKRGMWDADQAGAWFSNDSYLPLKGGSLVGNLGFMIGSLCPTKTGDPTPETGTSLTILSDRDEDDLVYVIDNVFDLDGMPICNDCLKSWEVYLYTEDLDLYEFEEDEIDKPVFCGLCNQDLNREGKEWLGI